MIWDSLKKEDSSRKNRSDPTKGFTLVILAIATSIDALAVGLSIGFLEIGVLYPALVIGGVAFVMTLLGSRLGPVIGKVMGKRAELLGGVVLIIIGCKILIDHL